MTHKHQCRPDQGRHGCEMLPGISHTTFRPTALREQRILLTHIGRPELAAMAANLSHGGSESMSALDRTYMGQRYQVIGEFQRQCRDGTMATILTWESPCAHCGEPFTITTPVGASKFESNRRCQKHKRPGHQVMGGGNA